MEHKSQSVGRENIRYIDFGGYGQPLLFAHGIGKKPIAYERLLQQLSEKGYRVIAPEMYGRNYLKRQPTSITQYSELTSDFIRSLKLEDPSMVGHSLGGIVSFRVARNLNNMHKIVALSPGLPMNRQGLKGIGNGISHYCSRRIKTPLKSVAFFVSNTIPLDLHLLKNPRAWMGVTNDVRALQADDFQAYTPSLILHAEDDELIEMDDSTERRIRENGVVIKRLDNLDHNWPISHSSLAADEITRFLE